MNLVSLIEKKKQGLALTRDEIRYFVKGAVDGSIPAYQLSALLMAIRLLGMNATETAELTLAMADSGDYCNLSSVPGIPVDKHSTGGVGDTTTLVLAPLVAACGASVAKMSGRGLGHTGGTLDKLESIPGFRIDLSESHFMQQVKKIGLSVIGQTKNLAPADKVLYALRDVTGTVDSIPLIASSIISKKLASGAKAIVLDVKTGEGAVMHTLDESIALAKEMVSIATYAGKNVIAFVTNMNEPLGSHVGNALEVKEAIEILSGRIKGPLLDVSLVLGSCMLWMAKIVPDMESGRAKLLEALENGMGLNKLREMITAQGGNADCCDDLSILPKAPCVKPCTALQSGYITSMHTVALGNIAQAMGAGRQKKEDIIDPSVGFVMHKRIGDWINVGDCIATVHAKNEKDAEIAIAGIRESVVIGQAPPEKTPLIQAMVTDKEVIRY